MKSEKTFRNFLFVISLTRTSLGMTLALFFLSAPSFGAPSNWAEIQNIFVQGNQIIANGVFDTSIEAFASKVSALADDPDKMQAVSDFLAGPGSRERGPILRALEKLATQVASDPAKASLAQKAGLIQLAQRLGLVEDGSPQRRRFIAQMDAFDAHTANFKKTSDASFSLLSKIKKKIERVGYGLLTGHLFATSVVFAATVKTEHLSQPAVIALAGATLAGSYQAGKIIWPRLKEALLRYEIGHKGMFPVLRDSKDYRAMVGTLEESLKADPDQALPYIRKLASTSGGHVKALQDAAVTALIRVSNPGTTKALFEVALDSIEDGHSKRALDAFNEIIQNRDPEGNYGPKASMIITHAIATKAALDKAIAIGKVMFLAKRVGGIGIGGALAADVFFPDSVTVVKSIAGAAVGVFGSQKILNWAWMHYPSKEVREATAPQRKAMADAFQPMIELFPDQTVEVLRRIAASERLSPLLKETARDALVNSSEPKAGVALEELGLDNIGKQGSIATTQKLVTGAFQNLADCNAKLRGLGGRLLQARKD